MMYIHTYYVIRTGMCNKGKSVFGILNMDTYVLFYQSKREPFVHVHERVLQYFGCY